MIVGKLKEPAIIRVEEHCADGWCGHVKDSEILIENINAPYAVHYATSTRTVQGRCEVCGTILKAVIMKDMKERHE